MRPNGPLPGTLARSSGARLWPASNKGMSSDSRRRAALCGEWVEDAGGCVDTKLRVALLPKTKDNPYFVSCRRGADEAAQGLGFEMLWDGPTGTASGKQATFVESWVAAGVGAIAVSAENESAVSPALRRARQAGVKVVTWDSDAEKDARDFFVNQATPEGIGDVLSSEAARVLCGRGEIGILTATMTSPNQNEWLRHIKARLPERYSGIRLVDVRPTNEDEGLARREAARLLEEHPQLGVILALCSPAVPGAAEAVKQAGRKDVRVIGTAPPSACRRYIHEGWVESAVLWNTVDLGFLAAYAAWAVTTKRLKPGDSSLLAGRLGTVIVRDGEIRLGRPHVFNKTNIDQFDF
jgi:ABC-type sugar transport system substrate-binding protein